MNFEVDSTESVWYNEDVTDQTISFILKLTPQSQYGIITRVEGIAASAF